MGGIGLGICVCLFLFMLIQFSKLSVLSEMSEELLQHFVDPVTLQHPGGHFIPASGPQKKVYQAFLQKMISNKKEKSSKCY